jgi:hypothetical protein
LAPGHEGILEIQNAKFKMQNATAPVHDKGMKAQAFIPQ